jgi:hypothetical protein
MRRISFIFILQEIAGKMAGDPIETASLASVGWDYNHGTNTATPSFGARKVDMDKKAETEQVLYTPSVCNLVMSTSLLCCLSFVPSVSIPLLSLSPCVSFLLSPISFFSREWRFTTDTFSPPSTPLLFVFLLSFFSLRMMIHN